MLKCHKRRLKDVEATEWKAAKLIHDYFPNGSVKRTDNEVDEVCNGDGADYYQLIV